MSIPSQDSIRNAMLVLRLCRFLLTLVIALVPVVGSTAPARLAHALGGADLATLVVLAGTVMVGNTADSIPAVDGQIVQVGDDVWTGPDGLALLTFLDGSETQLQGDSHITVEVPSGAIPGKSVSIFQSAGTTVNHVRHLSPGASFQTDTPSAVAMVRGTTYVVTVMPQPEAVTGETESTPSDVGEPPIPLSATAADPLPAASSDPAARSPDASQDPELDAPAQDQPDQLAARVGSAARAISSAPAVTNSCQRGSPADCVTSVVLLADTDGHVGHVEVASHVVGQPALHLTTHGDAAHISHAGAIRQLIPAAHLKLLHEATLHLHDVGLASRAHVVARHVVRAGLHPRPATPKPRR
jgi:hypothetical protein